MIIAPTQPLHVGKESVYVVVGVVVRIMVRMMAMMMITMKWEESVCVVLVAIVRMIQYQRLTYTLIKMSGTPYEVGWGMFAARDPIILSA